MKEERDVFILCGKVFVVSSDGMYSIFEWTAEKSSSRPKREGECERNFGGGGAPRFHTYMSRYLSHAAIQKYMPSDDNKHFPTQNKHVSLFFHPPVLKDSFRRGPSDVGVVSGSSARLECSPPRGSPAPTVFWKRNGKIVDPEAEDK